MMKCAKCGFEEVGGFCCMACMSGEISDAAVLAHDSARTQAIKEVVAICEEHAEWYPPDIFGAGSTGYGVRWKCLQLADEIRKLDPMMVTERSKP